MIHLYDKENKRGIKFIYKSVSDKELKCIIDHQYKLFPVRFFNYKNFCPTLDIEHAKCIASEKANWDKNIKFTHVLRFLIDVQSLTPYINIENIFNKKTLIFVPKAQLQQFNKSIIGFIECVDSINLNDPTNQLAFV